jgi:hypothetical protein
MCMGRARRPIAQGPEIVSENTLTVTDRVVHSGDNAHQRHLLLHLLLSGPGSNPCPV